MNLYYWIYVMIVHWNQTIIRSHFQASGSNIKQPWIQKWMCRWMDVKMFTLYIFPRIYIVLVTSFFFVLHLFTKHLIKKSWCCNTKKYYPSMNKLIGIGVIIILNPFPKYIHNIGRFKYRNHCNRWIITISSMLRVE